MLAVGRFVPEKGFDVLRIQVHKSTSDVRTQGTRDKSTRNSTSVKGTRVQEHKGFWFLVPGSWFLVPEEGLGYK